ncbi:dGTPase [Friedmanniella endophytica]|uniref:dGTPase n=1 Tax=Microlunatus kandeliicorticis TaxID=1759536 RepID=A0A7W3IQN8_9ACTN|nr:dNTP triphosphohydrolase [Microlunatus kandeliicorticis]MBA8793463.1 dGTPase [Microlunatus kandeliicorticis]
MSDPRLTRARAEPVRGEAMPGFESDFRTDLERIRFAPSFARLAEVTQVVTSAATGGVVHNRLSHSIKVTAIARAVAVRLLQQTDPALLSRLGGLDHVVVQAAAAAHDLGHPPFGHLGERTLDRLGRERFGLRDGFEGNAQTFRILTELEVHGPGDEGLNLTTAVRAAVCKYPWGRFVDPDPHPTAWPEPPRGAGHGRDAPGAAKFSAYDLDLTEMRTVLDAFADLPPGRQTLECSVMDLADDIAYSVHDVEDFHRSTVLQYSVVAPEFREWMAAQRPFSRLDDDELHDLRRTPGAGLERLRRRLATKDGWIYDEDTFAEAVVRVGAEFVDGVLAQPYDGSMAADRAVTGFTSRWIDELIGAVQILPDPPVRGAYVVLPAAAWHQVSVLKFVHSYFILERPDLAMFQRGQAETLTRLVGALDDWLSDRTDAGRAPRRLIDLITAARMGYERVAEEAPHLLAPRISLPELARMARGRGIIDYVSGLTDEQALAFAGRLGGRSHSVLWSAGDI